VTKRGNDMMKRFFRTALCAVALAGALVLSTTGAAGADPGSGSGSSNAASADRPVGKGTFVRVSTRAITCPAGSTCAWRDTAGNTSRCSWVNQDNDWWSTPTVCSWAQGNNTRALYNNGTSTNLEGVCYYTGANYTNPVVFLPQGWQWFWETGYRLRSHKWVGFGVPC
jgi:hypothetical protein